MARQQNGHRSAPAPRRVLTYDQALERARTVFTRDGGLDMQVLADEFPVGRATLYRVVGSRNRLLGDVLWAFAGRTLALAQREAQSASGVERVIEVSRRFKEHVLEFEPLRSFLRVEPHTALRVLLTPAGGVSQRIVDAWSEILRRSIQRGELTLPFDVDWFAYVFVRTGESIVYSDLLVGREPDLDLAEHVQRLLFRSA